MEFFPELEVSATQAEAIARGLYAVALVDGLHERELALISDFYGAATDDGRPEQAGAAALARLGPLDPPALAALLTGVPHRELFLKTAYLLAWADGGVSAGERASIDAFAGALDLAADTRQRLEAEVKDYLLRPFASLANVEGAAAVAKKLGL
jgi:uncharacterized membrane protein YebE (DUF533 family)